MYRPPIGRQNNVDEECKTKYESSHTFHLLLLEDMKNHTTYLVMLGLFRADVRG